MKETPPVRINITLYGASDETYARLCGNPQGFTQVTRAIRLLKEAGISVKINCSLTPYNADDLEGIFEFCREEQLIIQATSYMFPPLRRDASRVGQNDRFTSVEAAYYSAKIESLLNGEEAFLERMEQKKLEGLSVDSGDDCLDMDNGQNEKTGRQSTEGDGIRCRAGKCSFWVTWDGRFLPCGMLPGENAPNVFETGFDEAWDQAETDEFEMSEDKVRVEETGEGSLRITNLTDEEIPCVRIFYKFYMEEEQTYVGGITYTAKVTGLSAGGSQTVTPSHYSSGNSLVMMVRIYDTAQ